EKVLQLRSTDLQDIIASTTAAFRKEPSNNKFRPADIGYFDPHLSQSSHGKGDGVHIGQDLWFRDVHLFINQAKTQARLQRDIDEPTEKTTLLSFIQQLEAKKTAWGRFYALKLPEKPPQQFPQTNPWALSQRNGYSAQYKSNGNLPNQQIRQEPLRQWNGPRENQSDRQPYSQQQRTFQQPSQQPSQRRIEAPPQNAYHGEAEAESYGDAGDDMNYDPEAQLPDEAFPGHGHAVNFNIKGDVWHNLRPFTCNLCPIPQSFGNENELADHAADFHGVDPKSSTQKYVQRQWEYDQHARENVYVFRPSSEGYATINATVWDTHLKPCVDTGSGISVIDRSLLPPDAAMSIVKKVKPVTLKGVCGLQIAREIALFNLTIRTVNGENLEIPMRAYLVNNLTAGLIIGLGDLKDMDIVLHLKREIMVINGKDVKLTYNGGTNEATVSSMHIAVSKPTFIIHQERMEKWNALRKPPMATSVFILRTQHAAPPWAPPATPHRPPPAPPPLPMHMHAVDATIPPRPIESYAATDAPAYLNTAPARSAEE
ncbi:MAG: hypothetical protein Q9200_007731, partial [Gallowayella weberi]